MEPFNFLSFYSCSHMQIVYAKSSLGYIYLIFEDP